VKKLIDVMKKLRGPGGCPWDKKQSLDSLTPCLIEETSEIIDAVLENEQDKIEEEIGDLLCIVTMMIAIGEEEGSFTRKSVIEQAVKKMTHRHPHVFAGKKVKGYEQAHSVWHEQKNKEKGIKARKSVVDDISTVWPALHRADKIGRRVSRVGFDWDSLIGPMKKIREETKELEDELKKKTKNISHIEEEIGDVLFSVVNVARKLKLNAEIALRKTNNKFVRRFKELERAISREGKDMKDLSLDELDVYWEAAKNKIRKSRAKSKE